MQKQFIEESAKRDKMMDKLPDEISNVLYFFQKMTELRDKRKASHGILMTAMKKLLKDISIKTGIEMEAMETLAYWENPLQARDELIKRTKGVLTIGSEKGFYFVTGKKAEEYRKRFEDSIVHSGELRGTTAMKGKASGTVKVIRKISDFDKFEKGNILVTSMTRPEFVPIIEKAAAIVTDEGGITSHAAIVSREMKKPCVIGVQTATKVLKDGDFVEVDATNGVVKKITKEEYEAVKNG